MKGIILHGGHGDRLRPLTHTGAKQLIPVANKPISQYVLEDIRNSGITQIAIVLGDINPEKVKKYYSGGQRFQVKIKYIHQGEPKGIAHAVNLCRSYVNDDLFVVYLGDNLLKGGIANLVKKFRHSKQDAMILLNQVENPQRFGVAKFDKNGKLVQLIEKPKKPPSNLALTGIYFFKPVIFKMIKELKPSWRGELEITEAIQMLLDKGYKVGYQTVKGWWKDTGTPEDILEANRLVLDELEAKIESSTSESLSIQGRVSIGKDTTIEKGCTIRGPSIIGHHTIIKKDVYIGPYTSLGNYTTIMSGEIENSIIMDHCYIDIDDRINTSLIGSHSTISSNKNHRPKGRRFLIGERSNIEL